MLIQRYQDIKLLSIFVDFLKRLSCIIYKKESKNLNEDVIFTSNLGKRVFPNGLESEHQTSGLTNVFYSKNIAICSVI